jgi:adenosylcobinamide amidohydrolase
MRPALEDGCLDETALRVVREVDWLIARFAEPQRMASWAIAGGGLRRARAVAWLRVGDQDLRPPVNARSFLRERLAEARMPDAVGLLTSRNLDAYLSVRKRHGEHRAEAVVTVGIGNALRAGDPPGPAGRISTINILCHVSAALSDEGLLEALALAAEARTLAVREADVPSSLTGLPATGTGTDCIVIAAPEAGQRVDYAGKHTALGHLIGAVVHDAVQAGIAQCQRERACR